MHNIIEDMKLRSISCILASESWQKDSSKQFQKEVEELIEIEGMKMISKPRKYRRRGGVCIIADITKVSISPLDIPTGNLEIVWALLKPLNNQTNNHVCLLCTPQEQDEEQDE